jgi:integrase
MHPKHKPARPTGHLQVVERRSGRRYHALWRDADGRHQRVLGLAWVKKTGRHTKRGAETWRTADGPKPDGYLTPDDAAHELRKILAAAPSIASTGASRTSVTFAEVAEEWYDDGQRRRGLKRSTLLDYRQVLDAYLLPRFGEAAIDTLAPATIQSWLGEFGRTRTSEKVLMVMRAILTRARKRGKIDGNPAVDVERPTVRYSGDLDVYTREEIEALVRAAASEQDAAIFLTAALTGLRRGELVGLHWRDIDFTQEAIRVRRNYSHGQVATPKSGKVRTVPMVAEVGQALARLGQRERFTGDDEPVFVGQAGGYLDASALRRRYAAAAKRAGLRPLSFHSLRHFFGSAAVNRASIVQVQNWMGHADIKTTGRYLHAKSQAGDAALLAGAFAPAEAGELVPSDTAAA